MCLFRIVKIKLLLAECDVDSTPSPFYAPEWRHFSLYNGSTPAKFSMVEFDDERCLIEHLYIDKC